ncbi:hypothetical protein ABK040_002944 [Willaertia magna]
MKNNKTTNNVTTTTTTSTSNNDDENNNNNTTKSSINKKAGVFGRPLIPFFLESEENEGTPQGGYQVNEDLFLPEEHIKQQEELFIPKGENSIRVREFKDGYFEYKDISLDTFQHTKLTYSPASKKNTTFNLNHNVGGNNVRENNGERPQFYAINVSKEKEMNEQQNGNLNGLHQQHYYGKRRTSVRDHYDNYEKMVIPYQLYNTNMKQSVSAPNLSELHNNGVSSNNHQQQQQKEKKKKLVPTQVRQQQQEKRKGSTSSISNNNNTINEETYHSSAPSSPNNEENTISTQSSPILRHLESPVLTSTSLTGTLNFNNNYSSLNGLLQQNNLDPYDGLITPQFLLSKTKIQSTTAVNHIVPTSFNQQQQQTIDKNVNVEQSFVDESLFNDNFKTPPSKDKFKQVMIDDDPTLMLSEEQLLSSLELFDGSDKNKANTTTPSSVEKKQERFAGGSWSNSPAPCKIPKPNFKK